MNTIIAFVIFQNFCSKPKLAYFAERNKHRGEGEKKRQGFVIQHSGVVLTNTWSDRAAERRIADILCFVSSS
jgi:hypothetical protein